MADARGVVMRGRPRGATKVKVQIPAKGHSSSSSAHPITLPRIKASPNNNHPPSNEQQSSATPFSPRAREIPVALPITPHPPTPSSAPKPVPPIRPTAPSPSMLSEPLGFSTFEPTNTKTAWSTPRSPVPETTDSPSASLSALASFFTTDGTTPTPSRLLAVEESLLTTEQLYRVDWNKLRSDTETFLEIASTATQHVDAIQAELPAFQASNDDCKAALGSLSQDLETLHDQHAAERGKMLDQMDQLFTQQTDERVGLVETHAAEKHALQEAHKAELESVKAGFDAQIRDIEERAAKTESDCLGEIQALKERMASELELQREQAQLELEQLRTSLISQRDWLENELQVEIHTLRSRSEQELSTYRQSSETAYQELVTASQAEISRLKESSALKMERVLQDSASTLQEVTGKLNAQLNEVEEASASEIARLCTNHATELATLKESTAVTVKELRDQHSQELGSLKDELESQVKALNDAKRDRQAQVQEITARFTAEITTTKATMAAEVAALVKHQKEEVGRMRAAQTKEMADTVESYEKQIRVLRDQFAKKTDTLEHEARVTRELLVLDYEAQLRSNQESFRQERDSLVLQYETDLSILRRTTAEQVEQLSCEHDVTILQVRQGHALRVLSLETSMRERDKSHQEEESRLKGILGDTQRRLNEVELTEHHLRLRNDRLAESSTEEQTRLGMRLEEMEAAIVHLERTNAEKDITIDSLRRQLRSCEDECQTKSNTIMELTFVIKSRDEEIEKLHGALLDSIQNAKSKTEILELTAETLSTKAKELEDTRAALRLESGRLCIIEEDMHQKAGMLEDSELKVENMRLQMENLRLEMKRLQMDMKLQHEHSAGEMELKQGEIRRLYAAQVELKQRNDMQQETIVQLEASLAASQRQGDEARRRVELLRVEAAQYVEDARKLGDQLLDRDRDHAALTKDRHDLHADKQRLQIQLNNLQSLVQVQRETLSKTEMLLEDVHCQYQRRLEMTAAEKDERLRHERNLLLLELGALKETIRQYQDVEKRLQDSQTTSTSLAVALTVAREERQALAEELQLKEASLVGSTAELSATREAHCTVRERLELDIRKHALRIEELEQVELRLKHDLAEKEGLLLSMSSGASSLSDLLREKDEQLVSVQKDLNLIQAELDDARRSHMLEVESLRLDHERDSRELRVASQSNIDRLRETIGLTQRELDLKQDELDKVLILAQSDLESLRQSHEQALSQLRAAFESDQACVDESNRAEIERLRQGIATQEARVGEKDSALSKAQDLINSLRSEVERCEKRIAEKETAFRELEEAFSNKSATHSKELEAAEQRLRNTIDEYKALVDASEARLDAERRELAKTILAHQEANAQIAYLVTLLKRSEDTSHAAMKAMKEELDATQIRHKLAQENHQDTLIRAQIGCLLEVTALKAEIEAVNAAHQECLTAAERAQRESLESLEALRMREIEAVRMELVSSMEALRASRDDELNRALSAREEEHASHIREMECVQQHRLEEMETRLAAMQEQLSGVMQERERAQALTNEMAERVQHLKQQLEDKQRELDESLVLVRTRKATIESVRKEMALLMEMHKQIASVAEDNNSDPRPVPGQAEPSVSSSAPAFEQILRLVKQQVETYVTEEFHVEEVPNILLNGADDLLGQLKDAWRMRCCLSVATRARVLSVADVCASVVAFHSIASATKSAGASADEVESRVLGQLSDFDSLSATVSSVTGASCSAVGDLIEALSAYSQLFSELKSFTITMEEDASTGAIHVARNATVMAILSEHRAMRDMGDRVVASARETIGADFTKITDILPLLQEAQHLLHIIQAIGDGTPIPHRKESEQLQSLHLRTTELSTFLREKRQFEDELACVLECPSPSSTRNDAILDAVRSMVRVVHAFEFLGGSQWRQDDEPQRVLLSRTQEIVRFVEELKMVSKFAQSILDEEADATAGNQSHSSSTSSLLSVGATLARTPTPTSDLSLSTLPVMTDTTSNPPQPDDTDEQLFLSEDALAPPNEDTLRACPSGALSESLMDISLVMNDHYRILSEAAHWVNKANSLSPRHKRFPDSGRGQPSSSPLIDFPTETTQLVRDHCSLLSLARKLFRLQDPRQDLPTVLECLAVLARLNSRLGFFDLSIQASDSSDSLNSEMSETHDGTASDSSHKKPKASLSVFTSMEDMARHLQDYDSFIGRFIRANRHLVSEGQSPSSTSIANAETLAERIDERLTLLENLKTQLGLENGLEELPAFVAVVKSLAEARIDVGQTAATTRNWILNSVRKAFQDSDSLGQLLEQLRETMPFSSSAETPNELIDQLKEVLAQSDALISARDQAANQVVHLTDEIHRIHQQLEEEDKILDSVLTATDESSQGKRNEKLLLLIEAFHKVQAVNSAISLSIAEEGTLLQEALSTIAPSCEESEASPTSGRIDSLRRLLFSVSTLQQEKRHVEESLKALQLNVQSLLSEKEELQCLQKRIQEAMEEERSFLRTHNVIWGEGESRIPLYEAFLRERLEARNREQEAVENLAQESQFLKDHGFSLNTESAADVVASRLAVYKTLLSGQQMLIEEKMERELQDQQQRVTLEAEGIHIEGREEVVGSLLDARSRVVDLEKRIEELTILHAEESQRHQDLLIAEVEKHKEDLWAEGERHQEAVRREEERHYELLRSYEIPWSSDSDTPRCLYDVLEEHFKELSAQASLHEEEVEQERLFLSNCGFPDVKPCLQARLRVYETLLQREATAQQALREWDGSPHTNADGCLRADEQHRVALGMAEKNYEEAIDKAVTSALAKQAEQIAFHRAVYEDGEKGTVECPLEAATDVIAAITKRDNAAISMIYRLIRLSTDILNTSAFANVRSTGGGELPIELTQSVLACVKELKSLKEYLLQSLEQVVKDARGFVSATIPSSILSESPTDRDATIDFSLLLHRQFASEVQKILSEKSRSIQQTVDNLKATLVAHASVFSGDESQRMEMEIDAAHEVTRRQQVEARCEELEAFVRHLGEERKQVETALRQALQESEKAHEELIKKTQTLEQERSDAIAQAVSMGLMVSSASPQLTPRTAFPIAISRGYTIATNGTPVVPMRPDKPRELTAGSSRLKTSSALGTGTAHKERFVSDLEKETGQRRSALNAPSSAASQRRANDWKRHELLSSSMQIEQQFRAMRDDAASPFSSSGAGASSGQYMTISPPPKSPTSVDRSSLADQELWYQGVRMLQHVSFFVSVFFVPKQRTFRVEIFNSDTEQQQTIYVTLDEMRGFVAESRRAAKLGITLDDPTKHGEVVDVLFERVHVLGSDSSNMLFSFQ